MSLIAPSGLLTDISSVDSEGFSVIERAVAHVFPYAITVPYMVVGATDARHYAGVTDNT